MANFASISNQLEGIINSQLSSARTNQGVWEWYNALQRITSANYVTGTLRVVGPLTLVDGSNTIETNAVVVYGALVDNSHATENIFALLSDVAVAGGDDSTLDSMLFAAANKISTYVFPSGAVHANGFFIGDVLGTSAGQEAGTAVTTQASVVVVYTE